MTALTWRLFEYIYKVSYQMRALRKDNRLNNKRNKNANGKGEKKK